MRLTLFFWFFLMCGEAWCQIVRASMFSTNRCVNPASISYRRSGQYSVSAKRRKVKRTQTTDYADINGEIDIKGFDLFRGGNSSGGKVTSEFFFLTETGKKNEINKDESFTFKTDSDNSFTLASVGWGFGKNYGLAIQAQHTTIDNLSAYNVGTDESFYGTEGTRKTIITTLGSHFNLGSRVGAGLFASAVSQNGEFYSRSMYNNVKQPKEKQPGGSSSEMILGSGLGFDSQGMHAELGYETFTAELIEGLGRPVRITAAMEVRFGKLALGGRYYIYKGGFPDFENMLVQQMVYTNQEDLSQRSQTSFDFSWGSAKGHSVSGSYMSSNVSTEEENPAFGQGLFPTTTKDTSYSVKYGYTF